MLAAPCARKFDCRFYNACSVVCVCVGRPSMQLGLLQPNTPLTDLGTGLCCFVMGVWCVPAK